MKDFSTVKSALAENLARVSVGMRGEALNFLDSFCFVFLIKEKNESPSGRTIADFLYYQLPSDSIDYKLMKVGISLNN